MRWVSSSYKWAIAVFLLRLAADSAHAAFHYKVIAPMKVEGQYSGDVLLHPEGPGLPGYEIEKGAFLTGLRPVVVDDTLLKLESKAHDGFIDRRDIFATGLIATFDEAALEFRVEVPVPLRRTDNVYMGNRGQSVVIPGALSPSAVSGYMNVLAGDTINYNFTNAANGRQPMRTDLDGAINGKGFVLEGLGSYSEKSYPGFTRGDVRLVKDDPAHMIRYAVGDLSYPVVGYERYLPIGGITVASNFSLQPYRVTVPSSNYQLTLKSASRVVVWLNGARVQTLFLAAGPHNLRDLALGNGVSDVRLEITDDVGRTEIVNFPWVSQADMLAADLHQFAYNIGFPYTTNSAGQRIYDSKTPTFSASHRYGFNEHLTAGAFFQADHDQIAAGPELIAASRLGVFSLDPAISQAAGSASGYGVQSRYNYTDFLGPGKTQRNLLLAIEYRAPHFAALGELSAGIVEAYDLSASYGQTLFAGITARLTAEYLLNRQTMPGIVNGYNFALNFVQGWSSGMQLSVTLNDRKSQSGALERGIAALFSWAIPSTNHFVSLNYDSIQHDTRLDWRYTSPQYVNAINAQGDVERGSGFDRADLGMTYFGNRGQADATQDVTATDGMSTTQTTTAHLGAALVFAGGRFALSRPITDSFAIVALNSEISGQTVDVNPKSDHYSEAQANAWGPAVLPTIQSYQYYHLHFDPSRLDSGYELGKENADLLPSYKSGFLLHVGTEASIMLGGWLVDDKNQPLALVSGQMKRLDAAEATAEPITIFTNRKGKFRMEGFKPGTYELELFDNRWERVRVAIPNGTKGLFDAGRIMIRQSSKVETTHENK